LSNLDKLKSEQYRRAKEKYWKSVLARALPGTTPSDLRRKRVLEIGCGPSGLFMIAPEGIDYTCLDPLMDEYLTNFPEIRDKKLKYVNGKVEDFAGGGKESFDLILGFNAIDHVDDIATAMRSIYELSNRQTVVVLSLNSHNYRILQRVFSLFSFILDPLHKHQHTTAQYEKIFKQSGFIIDRVFPLDEELAQFEEDLGDGDGNERKRSWKSYIHPGNLVFAVLERIGLKKHAHNKKRSRAAYSLRCFVLKKDNE